MTAASNDASRSWRIRILLRNNPNGMTTREVADKLGIDQSNVIGVLHSMPDTYISRWDPPATRGPWQSVWQCVTPPPHAPRPTHHKFGGKK